ncbi:hypothetical protein, variant [Aphanomyces invadans]|uniref:Uncharacterized protein n=1 Tax=Aphanomyces invadans TaxID=157072 RepID=A0A024UDQ5_9STRA|nr:hypothetical protein, variant [Aphanomyces invadans]ETW04340.1 hypothetical protein, variant [Aphanomyces invadans]|eukprot:XP_008867296.1 hypothetical protein, variant [Aphanomyces invadans]
MLCLRGGASAAAVVLASDYLIRVVTQFQDGIFECLRLAFYRNKHSPASSNFIEPSLGIVRHARHIALDLVQTGDIPLLIALLQCHVDDVTRTFADHWKLIDFAALNGHLEVVEFLHSTGSVLSPGHLAVVEFLHTHRCEGCRALAMDRAAANGHLNVGCTAWAVAAHGHLRVIQYLLQNRDEGGMAGTIDKAASKGHLDVVKYLHAHAIESCTHRAMDGAAEGGHLQVVEFLHWHRREGCSYHAMNLAAKNGFFNIVRFLHDHRHEGILQ